MRKTGIVKIEDEGRDKDKIFVIKEAPAAVAERWATRAMLALARSGVELPDEVQGAGWAGIAVLGFKALAKANYDEFRPLLDEMWMYVSIRPDPRNDFVRALTWGGPDGEGADIEEIATIFKLRMEVFALHSGFSIPGVSSTSTASTMPPTSGTSRNTPTLTPSMAAPLRRHSPPGKRRS